MDCLAQLAAAREYAQNPDHIVRDPARVFEEGDRGCLVGILAIVGDGATEHKQAIDAVGRVVHAEHGSFLRAMRAGQAAILEVFDIALAAETFAARPDPAHTFTVT